MARAIGSYPIGHGFKSSSRYHFGPLVKRLRHGPFTAVTWVRFPYGSPKKESRTKVLLFLFCDSVGIDPLKTLCVLNMGIAARGIICTDYVFCDVCTYHLLARQDTDFVGMRIPNEVIGELALQWRVQVYSALLKFLYSSLKSDIILPRTANSCTKFRVARRPRDFLF